MSRTHPRQLRVESIVACSCIGFFSVCCSMICVTRKLVKTGERSPLCSARVQIVYSVAQKRRPILAHVRDQGPVCPLSWLTVLHCSYISVYSIYFSKTCMYVCMYVSLELYSCSYIHVLRQMLADFEGSFSVRFATTNFCKEVVSLTIVETLLFRFAVDLLFTLRV